MRKFHNHSSLRIAFILPFLSFLSAKNQTIPAAMNANTSLASSLLEGGADPNRLHNGTTPLLTSSVNGHEEAAEMPLAGGASANRAGIVGSLPSS